MIKKIIFTCSVLGALTANAHADDPVSAGAEQAVQSLDTITEDWLLRTSIAYSDVVMDPNEHITDKVVQQLRLIRDGVIDHDAVYISGYAKGSWMYEKTSTEDAFPILTRFPHHASGDTNSDFFTDRLMVGLTYAPTDWLFAFAQLEYHENRFELQNPVQARKAYVTLGNLDVAPVYVTAGRKTINFGRFDQYAPFTHTVSNHFFHSESDGPIVELGYTTDRFNVAATAISGGRHLRTADTAGDGTIDNFALSADATFELRPGYNVTAGASYLHGTIYNHTLPHHPGPEIDCPVMHGQQGVPKCRGRNGAWDVWAELNADNFDLQAEYTQTVDPWAATGERVSALTVQGRYKTQLAGRKVHLSGAYSAAKIGPFSMGGPGSPVFDKLDQMTLGAEMWLTPNMTVAAEYSRNTGFAPLVNVVSAARDATSNQFATGVRLSF